MKFIGTYRLLPNTYGAAVARFLETGGAPPPGVRILHRWHGMDGTGVTISETDDAKALFRAAAEWRDVIEISITPCVEDAEAGEVLAALGRR